MTQSEKIAKYEEIVPQIEALVCGVEYGISSLANITAVLDIDSDTLATFDDVDKKYLEKIVEMLKGYERFV